MRIAQLQTKVFKEKEKCLDEAEKKLELLRDKGIDLVTLGEMFNCPYKTSNFPIYAETDGGETWQRLSAMAKKYGVYFSAGSVPEKDEKGRIYNTAYVFDRNGKQIAKHRKMHLFDIDVEGGQYFKESDTLTAGDGYTVFETEFAKIGLCICFDCRFPELARLMVQAGAKIILVPAAFNMTTGPAHWEIMFRSRALDNQCYMIGTSCARDENSEYLAWGHTLIVSPWGSIIQEMDEKEGYIVNDIDIGYVDKIRSELPLLSARRIDIYNVTENRKR